MNIAVIIILILLLGAKKNGGGGSTPPGTPGCVGCCPGTSTHDGMLLAKAELIRRYGSWAGTPGWAQFLHTVGYGQCPGYNAF